MTGMFSKSEIKALKSNITRLLNSSIISKAEANDLRDLITKNSLKARYIVNNYTLNKHLSRAN